ncbi:hypothetical protein [Serratia sp. N21D137]|uniref:hypothetical protein n=1 Tax=Serratia sp. N21D137 TaxID=3397495 RepID=UPI0039DF78AB
MKTNKFILTTLATLTFVGSTTVNAALNLATSSSATDTIIFKAPGAVVHELTAQKAVSAGFLAGNTPLAEGTVRGSVGLSVYGLKFATPVSGAPHYADLENANNGTMRVRLLVDGTHNTDWEINGDFMKTKAPANTVKYVIYSDGNNQDVDAGEYSLTMTAAQWTN